MRIWLLTTGEPLPFDGGRRSRAAILARSLAARDHDVVWWTSTFDHQSKRFLQRTHTSMRVDDGFRVQFMHSRIPYRRNVSLARLLNHFFIARVFGNLASCESRPDIVVSSFPTIDLSYAAVEFGRVHRVPVVVDVRDLWPDIFVNPFPQTVKPVVRSMLGPLVRRTRRVFRHCHTVLAVSPKYLDWGLRQGNRRQTTNDRVFPLGYDELPKLSDTERAEEASRFKGRGVNTTKVVVWYVGTFGKTYDLGTIIRAARELTGHNIQFVLTGDGERAGEWRRLAADLPNVVFTNWVGRKSLSYLSGIADIGLLAYAKDAPQGLPNKIFEYMAAGVPMLSSLAGEAKEFIRQHRLGITYEAGDSASFVDAVTSLAGNAGTRREMGATAWRLFVADYAPNALYRSMADHVERLAVVDMPLSAVAHS